MTINNEKIISLELVRNKLSKDKCRHVKISVDENLLVVTCKTCGEKLNPIAILARFASEETQWGHRLKEIQKYTAKYRKKEKTKCQHCGRFTSVNW